MPIPVIIIIIIVVRNHVPMGITIMLIIMAIIATSIVASSAPRHLPSKERLHGVSTHRRNPPQTNMTWKEASCRSSPCEGSSLTGDLALDVGDSCQDDRLSPNLKKGPWF